MDLPPDCLVTLVDYLAYKRGPLTEAGMRAAGIYTRSKAKLLAVACLSLQGYWISEKREDYTEHDDIMPSLAVEKGAMAFLVSWKVCCHTMLLMLPVSWILYQVRCSVSF